MSVLLDPATRFRLDDRVVVVTGGGSHLGRRFAEVVSAAGATVVVTSGRPGAADDAVARLPRVDAMVVNLREAAGRADCVESVLARHGRIDVLVNTVGVAAVPGPRCPSGRGGPVIDLQLSATYDLARRVASGMIEQRSGTIVNVAYISGPIRSRSMLFDIYGPAKEGLLELTRELASQWGAYGVRVNCLSPGWIDPVTSAAVADDDLSRGWLYRRTPMRRTARLDELDGALLFLASEASSFVTGHDLVVDGGWACV